MTTKNNIPEAFDDMEHEAPYLSKMGKQNPFDVPEGYFDALPQLIQQQCIEERNSASAWEKFRVVFSTRFALPFLAAAVLFAGAIRFMNRKSTDNALTLSPVMDSMSLADNVQNMEETLIIETLENMPGNKEEAEPIIDYLLDNDIETVAISNEL